MDISKQEILEEFKNDMQIMALIEKIKSLAVQTVFVDLGSLYEALCPHIDVEEARDIEELKTYFTSGLFLYAACYTLATDLFFGDGWSFSTGRYTCSVDDAHHDTVFSFNFMLKSVDNTHRLKVSLRNFHINHQMWQTWYEELQEGAAKYTDLPVMIYMLKNAGDRFGDEAIQIKKLNKKYLYEYITQNVDWRKW